MKIKNLVVLFIFGIAGVMQSCSSSSDKPVSVIHKSTAAHEQVAEQIQKIVSDPKRADEAVSISEQILKETEDFLEDVIASREKAIELSENYDTARESFETHSEYKLAGGSCLFSNILINCVNMC